jgi:hypothetical protein
MFVERLVTWFYTSQYPEFSPSGSPNNEKNPVLHAAMYVLAHRLEIPRLELAAVSALKSTLDSIATSSSSIDFMADLLPVVCRKTPLNDRALRDPLRDLRSTNVRWWQIRA